MADSTFLAPELSDTESMGEETVRFQELLLKASKEPHAELDAKGQGCTAYDVAVNSNFYLRMQNSDFLRELVVTIAREGLEDKYGLQRPRIQELGTLDASGSLGTCHGPERPHLNLWLEAPDLLLAEVDLPKLDGAQGLALEIGENRLVIGGPQQLYHLDATVPLRINSEASRAAFHRRRKQLMVSMPLLTASS